MLTDRRAARIWHPWRHLRRHHPHVHVTTHQQLPAGLRAAWTLDGIWLRPGLTQAERRCALTHELIHLERGPVPKQPVLAAAEERIVADLAARRLIPLGTLTEALHWVDLADCDALAEELWVDDVTLRNRLQHLTQSERDTVNHTLDHRRPWNMDT